MSDDNKNETTETPASKDAVVDSVPEQHEQDSTQSILTRRRLDVDCLCILSHLKCKESYRNDDNNGCCDFRG